MPFSFNIAIAFSMPSMVSPFRNLVRVSLSELSTPSNSLSKPEPFAPNTPTTVHFTLQDAFHTFRKGHRVMVQVQSTWFPMIDRNPGVFLDIYRATDADFRPTTQRVYRSPDAPSSIMFHRLP